ncbi:MAG: GAF domain-containing protein [Deltaproteobacteria bacterium]|nr:GAF domain-containing protein [Deltaproteobacteria bacterium]
MLFTFLILMLAIMAGTDSQPGLYLILLIAFTATLSLKFLPIDILARVIPLSIGTYIIFIHAFLSYIGEAHNQYKPLYLLPMILASFLFGYFGAFTTFIMTFFSHIILVSNTSPTVPSYAHLILSGLPFFTIAALLSFTALFIARILKEDKENMSSLIVQIERTKEALTRELETIKILHNTDRAILSSINRKETLKICVINLRALINAEYVSIATLEEDDIFFRLEISSLNGILEEHEDMIPLESTILKRSVSSKASRYYPEVYPDDLLDGDMDIRDKGVRRLLIVPLIAKGIPLGALNIGSLESPGFSREDIDLAEKYALQVAIAIDNSNLYEGAQNLFMNTITSLSSAIDAKSRWTKNHSECVAEYAIAIACELSLDETFMKDLRIAVLLHDIGKIGISDTIINNPMQTPLRP